MTANHSSARFLQEPSWSHLSWLVHGFTTRHAGDLSGVVSLTSPPEELGAEGFSVATAHQVHSNGVHEIAGPGDLCRRDADALLTARGGFLLSVRTADCLPLLLIDPRRRVVAAVHAGWRGSVQGVAAKAAGVMRARYNSRWEDIEVSIGPGIGACCFEVGPEVAAEFNPADVAYPPALSGGPPPRPRVDLAAANRRQLLAAGIPDDKIHTLPMCTVCLPAQFFSFRREGDSAGRMLAFIGIRPEQ